MVMLASNKFFPELLAHTGQAASLLKAISNEHRLMILCTLQSGELSVGALNKSVSLSQSALSQHLAVLRKDNLVATRRDSQTIYYTIADERVLVLMQTLQTIFSQPEETREMELS